MPDTSENKNPPLRLTLAKQTWYTRVGHWFDKTANRVLLIAGVLGLVSGGYALLSWKPTIASLEIANGRPLAPAFEIQNSSWFTMTNTLGVLYPGSGRRFFGMKPDFRIPVEPGMRGPCRVMMERPENRDLRTADNLLFYRRELRSLPAGNRTTFAPDFEFNRDDSQIILGVAVQYAMLGITRRACIEFMTVRQTDGTFTMIPFTTN